MKGGGKCAFDLSSALPYPLGRLRGHREKETPPKMTASPAHLGRGSFMPSLASRTTARPGSPPRPAAALGPPLELPPAPPPGSVPPSSTESPGRPASPARARTPAARAGPRHSSTRPPQISQRGQPTGGPTPAARHPHPVRAGVLFFSPRSKFWMVVKIFPLGQIFKILAHGQNFTPGSNYCPAPHPRSRQHTSPPGPPDPPALPAECPG